MGQGFTIHFVDSAHGLRVQIARLALALGYPAQIYAGLDELALHAPGRGIVIIHDERDAAGVAALLEELAALGIWLPLVIAAQKVSLARIVGAVRAGALDFLALPAEPEAFAALLRRAVRAAPAQAAARRRMIEARGRIARLSERERAVFEQLVAGGSNKFVARNLRISPRTVEIHRANMMAKLEAQHFAHAVRLWFEARLDAEGG